MTAALGGVIPILHTAYRNDGSLDLDAVRREVDWVFDTGADGCGIALASDLLRLTPEERRALSRCVIAAARDRGPVVMSVGAESAGAAVAYARDALAAGASALMAIPPVEGTPGETEVRSYYEALLAATPLPVIVQDASAYLGRAMTPEFQVSQFAAHGPDRILFKPEGAAVGATITRLHALTGGRARIFEGSGGVLLVENFRRGLAGTMPGCDLLDAIVPLWRALGRGDDDTAYRLWYPVAAIALLEGQAGLDGYLAIERYLMVKRGLFASDRMRGAGAWTPDAPLRAELDRLFARLRQAVSASSA